MTELREALQEYAQEAPSAVGLLDAVRVRARRRQRVRVAGIGGVAVLALAGAAVVVPALWPSAAAQVQVGTPAPVIELVPASYWLRAFPFTPGWAPAGIGEPFVGFSPGGVWLSYPRVGSNQPPIMVSIEDTEPTWITGKIAIFSTSPQTVRGQAGTLRQGTIGLESIVALTWQADGRWMSVVGSNTVNVDDVIHFAESLVEQPIAMRPPFVFDLVPAGTTLVALDSSMMQLAPLPNAAKRDGVVVQLQHGSALTFAGAPTVAGRPMRLEAQNSAVTLSMLIDADRVVVITLPEGTSEQVARAFANGVHVTADAKVGNPVGTK
jgi:hypothetical protein